MKTIKIVVLGSGLENEIIATKVMGWRSAPYFGTYTDGQLKHLTDASHITIITMDSGGEYEVLETAASFRKRLAHVLDELTLS